MERNNLVRFRAGKGQASDMGRKFRVIDIQGDTVELHHDRLGYRFADRSKLEPWVDGAVWTGSKYIDPVQPGGWDTVTLRDRFALSALAGIVRHWDAPPVEKVAHYAKLAYDYADAMLAARSRNTSDVTG